MKPRWEFCIIFTVQPKTKEKVESKDFHASLKSDKNCLCSNRYHCFVFIHNSFIICNKLIKVYGEVSSLNQSVIIKITYIVICPTPLITIASGTV